jgi:hypothetical protein
MPFLHRVSEVNTYLVDYGPLAGKWRCVNCDLPHEKKIEERTAANAERVDPSLYHVVRSHPGAPLRPELSSEGRLRAWRVGAQVGEGEASALVEAWKRVEPSRGDVVVVSEKHGTTWTAPVAVGTPEAVASLVERGMFERVTADDLQGVRVTKAGVDAINAGLSEEERLLERIKRASPEELAEQFKARKARLAEAAKAAKAERAAAKEKAAADATKGNSETAAERFRAWGESHHKTAEERADRLREPDSFWWIHHENHPDVVIARFHPARLVVLEYVIDGLD